MSTLSVHPFGKDDIDILEWYPKFLSCARHFVDHAQYTLPVRTVAAFINIKLPHQKRTTASSLSSTTQSPSSPSIPNIQPELLTPYIRRLVATAFDSPSILYGFFGDDWLSGIGPLHNAERRNYLFAAKSDSWLLVKAQYDIPEDGQTCPFLKPLQNTTVAEIEAAEASWSDWLAMQDWMLGPRAPTGLNDERGR